MTTATTPHDGTAIRCSCCDGKSHKLGEVHPAADNSPGYVRISDTRHGREHVALVPAREVLARLAGTTGREGIEAWVRRVVA